MPCFKDWHRKQREDPIRSKHKLFFWGEGGWVLQYHGCGNARGTPAAFGPWLAPGPAAGGVLRAAGGGVHAAPGGGDADRGAGVARAVGAWRWVGRRMRRVEWVSLGLREKGLNMSQGAGPRDFLDRAGFARSERAGWPQSWGFGSR